MKKNFIVCFLLTLTSLFATAQSEKQLTFFTDRDINGLITNGNFDVQLSQGSTTGVTVTIAADVEDKLEVSITEDNMIRITYRGAFKAKPLCKVVVSNLDYLSVSGTSVIAKGEFSSNDKFNALYNGNAFVAYLKVKCQDASLDVKGFSKVEDFVVTASSNVEISINDSAKAAFQIHSQSATLTSSGVSLLNVQGSVSGLTKILANGTSTLDLLELKAPKITASALGMSRIKANVTGQADVTCGGTASFRYTGSGTINTNTKGVKPL